MELAAALVFVGTFATVALVLYGFSSSRKARQAQAALETALALESRPARMHIPNLRKDSRLSTIPWLNRSLLKLELAPYLHKLLNQANLKWNLGRVVLGSLTCLAVPAYAVYARFGMLLPALGVGLLLGSLPFGWALMKRGRRFERFQEEMPGALDMLVSALRAGHSLIAAMGLVSRECPEPVSGEFKICFDEQNYGLEMKQALDNLVERVPLQDLKIVVTAILIQKESGGNLAEVLDKTAHVIRERFRLKRQVKVHTAQGRMTGWILSFLPLVLGVAMYLLNPNMISILWHREIGIKLLWTAAGMTVLGGLVIRQIVNPEV